MCQSLLLSDESKLEQSEDLVIKLPSQVESCVTISAVPMDEDDGCSKVNDSQNKCSHNECQAHTCVCYSSVTCRRQKIPKLSRHMSFKFFHCQCGKCSFYFVINHTCPNGYDAVSSSRVFACVYPTIAAENGVIPKDRGPGTLLLPINLVGGPVGELQHYAIMLSVDTGVKYTLLTQTVNKLSLSTPEEPSLSSELDLNLVFFCKALSGNDQIVHTALCTPSGGSTRLHSLELKIKLHSPVDGIYIPTASSPFFTIEHLSVIQQCVCKIFHMSSTHLLLEHLPVNQQSVAVATAVQFNVLMNLSRDMDVNCRHTGRLYS